MKKKLHKGFTLAELLIVVAIIAVLVAISIPIFSNQLKKARLATNQANARAAYAAWVAQYMDEGMPARNEVTYYTYNISTGKIKSSRALNFGHAVGNSNPSGVTPITDISSWKTTTHVYNNSTLGAHVYKYWQMRVEDGKVVTYYAWLDEK